MSRYIIDAAHSEFHVQAFATGLLSFVGHSPTFAIRNFTGAVEFVDDLIAKMRLELTVPSGQLLVLDDMKLADRREIEDRTRDEVLQAAAFPEITFRASTIAAEKRELGRYAMTLEGPLSLRGVSRPYRVGGELKMFSDGLRISGETSLRMSDFGIHPVSALGGTLRLKDEVNLKFELLALPEKS